MKKEHKEEMKNIPFNDNVVFFKTRKNRVGFYFGNDVWILLPNIISFYNPIRLLEAPLDYNSINEILKKSESDEIVSIYLNKVELDIKVKGD